MGMRTGGLGIGGLLLVLVLSWATGIDFLSLLGGGGSARRRRRTSSRAAAAEHHRRRRRRPSTWSMRSWTMRSRPGSRSSAAGISPTTAVLFRDAIQSACGFAQSATGPFYCPADQKVYLDLGFFGELQSRFGAPGDFARAYVIAHELGHHVQTLTGHRAQVRRAQSARPDQQNALSVRAGAAGRLLCRRLGPSCRQGRGGNRRVTIETGDVEAGLKAAAAIGDDRIQRMQTGRVAPDRFTHGSSEQRVTWFRRGLESGDPKACNTFQ